MISLANPLGLLALFGIPAVLAIHFLQRKSRVLPISTLFLLEQTRRQNLGGRRFERLAVSLPLWMQLIAVLLLAWLLAEPRFRHVGSVRRVAIVLDSSASMSAFKPAAIGKISELLPGLKSAAAALEITALESTPESPRIYSGTSPGELARALAADWQPSSGPVDPHAALRLARTVAGPDGTVLFVTDTPPEAPPPFSALPVSIGRPLENTGITGVSFSEEQETLVWKAIIRNFGKSPARRTWQAVTSGGSSTAREILLPPGGMATLQAAFPPDAHDFRIVLSPDDFPLDDVLPLVAPAPKKLAAFTTARGGSGPLVKRIIHSLDAVSETNDAATADLRFSIFDPLDPAPESGNAVVFTSDETRTGAWLKGGIVSANHPLVTGLNWQALLVRESIALDPQPSDTVLVRQGPRPLILLRGTSEGSRQLVFNFDPTLSNLPRQPAFIVLLHRFVETLRAEKIAPFAGNHETGETVAVPAVSARPVEISATDPAGAEIPVVKSPAGFSLRQPGFLTVRQDGRTLFHGAFHFGDPRESDFSSCQPLPAEIPAGKSALARDTRPDPLRNIWLLLLVAALLLSWFVKSTPSPAATADPA